MFDQSLSSGFGALSMPVYTLYEATHAALGPARAFSDAAQAYFRNPGNPLSFTPWGKSVAAACEVFERVTRRYGKRPFCKLVHFSRGLRSQRRPDPKMLIVAPMSGHYATLLRGTVAAFLPNHE